MKPAPNSRPLGTFLLVISGLGGLLYGVDIGVIDPALSYLNRSIQLSERALSAVVAAVLAGSIVGSVVAGVLADWLGRKRMMIGSGLIFVASVAIIFASQSFLPLLFGRLLQGASGGMIAVVAPLYLAECLPSNLRGRGAAVFQFMLTVGIVLAALVGGYYTSGAEKAIEAAGADTRQVIAAADHAWRGMFLAVVYPGLVFLLGTLFLPESPRWLVRKGRVGDALHALQRMRADSQCETELHEIRAALAHDQAQAGLSFGSAFRDIFTQRRYIVPFVLSCVILGCCQATGINSILQFMSTILRKAGLDPLTASLYGGTIKLVNSVMTIVAIVLVERKGRVFLLSLGTSGIIVSLLLLGSMFYRFESHQVDVRDDVTAMVRNESLFLDLGQASSPALAAEPDAPLQVSILYNLGDKQLLAEAFMPSAEMRAALKQADAIEAGLAPAVRTALATPGPAAVDILRTLPGSERAALEDASRIRERQRVRIPGIQGKDGAAVKLEIVRARAGPIPSRESGLVSAFCIGLFIASFSIGPGVCVWLALSELMPTRIRSVGMGVALLINQGVSTLIALAFLPIVGRYGFHAMFLFWAACTGIFLLTVRLFLPETKGKTLEEIEKSFA
jgi:MFS family permease